MTQCKRCLSSTFNPVNTGGRTILGLGCEFCKELKVAHQVPIGLIGEVYIAEFARGAQPPYEMGRLESAEVEMTNHNSKKKRK